MTGTTTGSTSTTAKLQELQQREQQQRYGNNNNNQYKHFQVDVVEGLLLNSLPDVCALQNF